MVISLFFSGLGIGLSLAAPVGPVSVICIQRTLSGGRMHGVISGLGVATADAIYAAIAVSGLSWISDGIQEYQFFFRVLGGLLLMVLGLQNLKKTLPVGDSLQKISSYYHDFSYLFVITLANPVTVVFFAAILSGTGIITSSDSVISHSLIVLSIFLGSMIWWVFLSLLLGVIQIKKDSMLIKRINFVSGFIIGIIGAVMIFSSFVI